MLEGLTFEDPFLLIVDAISELKVSGENEEKIEKIMEGFGFVRRRAANGMKEDYTCASGAGLVVPIRFNN